MKYIEGDLNKGRRIQCPWTRRHNIVKITILSKLIHRSNAVLATGQHDLLHSVKFCLKYKGSRIANTILQKKPEVGSITLSDCNIYYNPTVIRQCGIGEE